MFKKNHTKFAEVLGGAVSVDDFTPESLKFLRDVKEQQDKADAQEWEEVKQQAARGFEYSGDHRRALEIMNCDEKVLNDRELFRPGTLDDYNMWLLDYLKQGGKITHYYDYNFQWRYLRVVNNTQKRVFLKNPDTSNSSSLKGTLSKICIPNMIVGQQHIFTAGRTGKPSLRDV